MTITWHRNEDGTGTTDGSPVTPGPQARVTLVDPDDAQAKASWAESLRADYRRACRATEAAEDDGTAFSTDTTD